MNDHGVNVILRCWIYAAFKIDPGAENDKRSETDYVAASDWSMAVKTSGTNKPWLTVYDLHEYYDRPVMWDIR